MLEISRKTFGKERQFVFVPKYRRKVFYGDKRNEIVKILKELCKWKRVNIVKGKSCFNHIYILVEIPPKIDLSSFMEFLKGKSGLVIYEKCGDIKYQYCNR